MRMARDESDSFMHQLGYLSGPAMLTMTIASLKATLLSRLHDCLNKLAINVPIVGQLVTCPLLSRPVSFRAPYMLFFDHTAAQPAQPALPTWAPQRGSMAQYLHGSSWEKQIAFVSLSPLGESLWYDFACGATVLSSHALLRQTLQHSGAIGAGLEGSSSVTILWTLHRRKLEPFGISICGAASSFNEHQRVSSQLQSQMPLLCTARTG